MEIQGANNSKKKKNVLPILALIFAFVFPLAGFILSIISLAKKKEKKGISIAALIISIVVSLLIIALLIILIVVSPYAIVTALLLLVIGLSKHENQKYSVEDPSKELTNYFYESPITSARYLYKDENNDIQYIEIPENKLDLFVDTLNSFTISYSSNFNGDYYGWREGIECTLEDGTYFMYDGEYLVYYDSNGDRINSRYVFVKEDFWDVLENFNKSKKYEMTVIEVYGFIDSSDNRDYIFETQDGFYISLNNKLYFYSDESQECVLECEEELGPVINISDEYILFIQRSYSYDIIKKLDLNTGNIVEECYCSKGRYKEAFFDYNNDYFFAYKDDEILCLNVKEDSEYYVRYSVSEDGNVKYHFNSLPEGYYAKQDANYMENNYENRLIFYRDTDDGYEILKYNNQKSLEFSITSGDSDYEIGYSGDSFYKINSFWTKFSLGWEKNTLSKLESEFSCGDDIYEDSSNRIIGYDPDNQIVYLYSFENNSIIMKNIEDDSETDIVVLDDAEKILFEWEGSKLYWKYINDDVETYGGYYNFATSGL